MAESVVLSVFPGIDLLGRAFEEAGFCVVRGPDVLWGGDIRSFQPPAGVFAGVIGGPPCQSFSRLVNLIRAQGREPRFGNLIPEFERVVAEASPEWFLMENVPGAPTPTVEGYVVRSFLLNNRWCPDERGIGAEQNRERRISFGTGDGRALEIEFALLDAPLHFVAVTGCHEARRKPPNTVLGSLDRVPVKIGGNGKFKATVTSSDGAGKVRQTRYTVEEACRLQGLPEDFLADAPFTKEGKLKAVANGVPLPMGRAIARAVLAALAKDEAAV